MVENQLDGEVLGVVFDGSGYGDDQTIWGGIPARRVPVVRTNGPPSDRFAFPVARPPSKNRGGWRSATWSMPNAMSTPAIG